MMEAPPATAEITMTARCPLPVPGEKNQRLVCIEILDVSDLKLEPLEKRQLFLGLSQLKQYKTAHIAQGILIVGTDMGPLAGKSLEQAILMFKNRVILQVMRFREVPHLELVHSV